MHRLINFKKILLKILISFQQKKRITNIMIEKKKKKKIKHINYVVLCQNNVSVKETYLCSTRVELKDFSYAANNLKYN